MTSLWRSLRPDAEEQRSLSTVEDYAAALGGYGAGALGQGFTQTLDGNTVETIHDEFASMAQGAMRSNGVIFACMLVRQLVFSAVRFQYQRFNAGRPSELFGDATLDLMERPWTGGTTQDLLARTIQDADLAGNSFWTVHEGELVRLRPDWVQVVSTERVVAGLPDAEGRRRPARLGWKKLGYVYTEGGAAAGGTPLMLPAGQVAHFAPIPDPLHPYRGMSWLTPIIREVQADGLMTRHRMKFFEHGATPSMVVKHGPGSSPESVRRWATQLAADQAGVDNAYKTLNIGGGADVTVVGSDLRQVEFTTTQGHGETRIAAAAGVPPVIVGLSEGLQSATYSNYGQARRRLADGTMHPLWANVAGSMQGLTGVPPGARLWYDSRDVPFLREDSKDAAAIAFTQAQTMRQLIDAGYQPESVSRAVLSGDFGLLTHSGLYSVQLRPAGENDQPGGAQQDQNTPTTAATPQGS